MSQPVSGPQGGTLKCTLRRIRPGNPNAVLTAINQKFEHLAEDIARVNPAILRTVTKRPRRKNGMRVEPFSKVQQVLRRSERF